MARERDVTKEGSERCNGASVEDRGNGPLAKEYE